jgi:microcystin-dependent protein
LNSRKGANKMDDVFIGQIMLFAGNFVPEGYVACDGSLLSRNDYPHLFSLFGTIYGGDGAPTFAVPDLRGRIPIGIGSAQSGSSYSQGASGGEASVTLANAQMPNHTHTLYAENSTANQSVPGPNAMFGNGTAGEILPYNDLALANGTVGSFSNASITQSGGGGGAHENRMPCVGLQYIMAVDGIYPSA